MHWAAAYGAPWAVERPLAAGAARSEIGFRPTHWRVVRSEDREVPEAPLAVGAGIMARDGYTPRRAAAEHPNSKGVKTLLDFGADANARLMSGTPLHLTARRADPEALEIPLQAGAGIHAAFATYPRTEDELMNVTALHAAAVVKRSTRRNRFSCTARTFMRRTGRARRRCATRRGGTPARWWNFRWRAVPARKMARAERRLDPSRESPVDDGRAGTQAARRRLGGRCGAGC